MMLVEATQIKSSWYRKNVKETKTLEVTIFRDDRSDEVYSWSGCWPS